MRVFLHLLAAVALIGPIIFWAYVAAMACAFLTNSNNSACGVDLSDFLDAEFLEMAVVPWGFAVVCILVANRIGKAAE